MATTFGKETDAKSSNGLRGRNPCPPDVGPFSLPIPGPQAQALDKPFLSSHLLTPGLRGLQFYRLHREERPNYRLECLQWLKSQPQWPSWGWNQVSCPCSWQQGRWDLRFQPVSIGDTTFPPPTSSPTALSARALFPETAPACSRPAPGIPGLGLSGTGLVSGLLGLGSRQLCSFTSWRGGVCCSYGPWGEFREGWHVQHPWQFGA